MPRAALLALLGLAFACGIGRAQDTAKPLDDWITHRFDEQMTNGRAGGGQPGGWTFTSDALLLSARLSARGSMAKADAIGVGTPDLLRVEPDLDPVRRSWTAPASVGASAALGYQFLSGNEGWLDYRYVDVSDHGPRLFFHTFGWGWQPCLRDGRVTAGWFIGARGLSGSLRLPPGPVSTSTTAPQVTGTQQIFSGNLDADGNAIMTDVPLTTRVTTHGTLPQASRLRFVGGGPESGMDLRFHFDDYGLTLFGRGRAAVVAGAAKSFGYLYLTPNNVYLSRESSAAALFPWFADVGLSWRPPLCPELEVRGGYHLESLTDAKGTQLLFAHGAFAGLGWSF